MPKIVFLPSNTKVEVDPNTKILAAARRAKVPIRFACGAARCGSCAVKINDSAGKLSDMHEDEHSMLTKIKLPTDGPIRLACQARILEGQVLVDLDFQNKYSPDVGYHG